MEPIRLVDIAIAWICVETIITLTIYIRRGRKSWAIWSLANAAAGLMLFLTLRAVLAESGSFAFMTFLAGALIAHLIELALRPGNNTSRMQ